MLLNLLQVQLLMILILKEVRVIERSLGPPTEVEALRVVQRLQLFDAIASVVQEPFDAVQGTVSTISSDDRKCRSHTSPESILPYTWVFLRSAMLCCTSEGTTNEMDWVDPSCLSRIAATDMSAPPLLTYSIVQTLNGVILCLIEAQCESSLSCGRQFEVRASRVRLRSQ